MFYCENWRENCLDSQNRVIDDYLGLNEVDFEEQVENERYGRLQAGLQGKTAEISDFTLINGKKIEDLEVRDVENLLGDLLDYGLDCDLDERDRAIIRECKRVLALKDGR